MSNDGRELPDEDEFEWKTDEDEEADEFPMDDDEDEKQPVYSKKTSASKTIFVTYQFRFFQDDYDVIGPIGEPGQFGIAYECYLKSDSSKTRKCVKEINKARFHHIASDERNTILATMQNEIAILKKVDHPNIVKLFDVYEDRHKLHLVMEFLPGGELFARICEKESFSEKEAAKVLKMILEALDHMHDKNILHLDLKPDNILFANKSDESPIKLIDFGMARVVPRLAKLKDRVGTPNYMAPEVFEGNYSKGADVWSLGVILFCMLFGFPPFYADNEDIHLEENAQLEKKIKQGFTNKVLPGYGPWFPEDLEVSNNCRTLLSKMLEMDVKRRWTVKECLSSQWVRGFASEKTIPPIVRDALKKFHGTSKFKAAVSNLFKHQVDDDHIREMKKWFEELDTDNDGSLSLKEFKEGMKKYETDLDDEQLEQVFSNIDIDDSRGVSFDEILSITSHRMLVDEDERLYQAFRDLDEDGNGLISQQELEKALNNFDKNNASGHQRRESRMMITRFKSAFFGADKNNDGQIDYEEFLRVIHPDFTDDKSMQEFKQNVIDGKRAHGAGFNVDFDTAQVGKYMEPVSPSKQTIQPMHINRKLSKTLTLDAFKKTQSTGGLVFNSTSSNRNDKQHKEEISSLKKDIKSQKEEVTKYKEENDKLREKIDKIENSRDELRDKYENKMLEMLDKIEKAQNETNKIKNELNENKQIYQNNVNEKNKEIDDKDGTISNLNNLLVSRNEEIDQQKNELQEKIKKIKNMENMLKNAIDSKMKSLIQSQKEMQKLKMMINSKNKKNGISLLTTSSSISASPTYSKNKRNHNKPHMNATRHLSHQI